VSVDLPERRVVISGVGQSRVGRRLGVSGLSLTFESISRAIEDAGLTSADIDGISTFPGAIKELSPGFIGADLVDVLDGLRLNVSWHQAQFQGASQAGAVISAILAVSAGLCRHAVIYRTVTESTGQAGGPRRAQLEGEVDVAAPYDWLMATGAVSAASWLGLYAERYMQVYGISREQLGWIPIATRRHAGRNPAAVLRDPITLEDYLQARLISTPFCLYDCDLPVDGSTAFVVSAADTAPSLRSPVRVEAMSTALCGRPMWEQWEDMTKMATHAAASQMWGRTSLGPSDVDLVQFYDGFSFVPLMWLEAAGFCGPGEATDFVYGGDRIDLEGELPMNTSGGQLSAGRLHGFGVLAEAVRQVRGEAQGRQVVRHDVALAGVGGAVMASSLLLTC
jgi:acetyl-CoA acetyltransferase